jgi:hypothetical protein
MICDDAVAAERQGQLELAADLYEQSLAQEPMPLWAMLNLIVLYWQCAEYGFWVGRHLSADFAKRAGARLHPLLSMAQARSPDSTELAFWCRYIRWADLGEPLSIADCEQLLTKNPKDLTPVVFLYPQRGGQNWAVDAMRLLEQCRRENTTRAGYISSVIEAARDRYAKGRQ